jgi:hypothetical protein
MLYARGEPDPDHPVSDRGKEKTHEGADKALGYCPLG